MTEPPLQLCVNCTYGAERQCVRGGRFDPDWVAESYLAYWDVFDGPGKDNAKASALDWATECLDDMVNTDPHQAFTILLRASNLIRNVQQAAVLAASPLENLIAYKGKDILNLIEEAATSSARFRFVLSGVWPQGAEAGGIWKAVLAARAPGPDMDRGDPLPVADIPLDML